MLQFILTDLLMLSLGAILYLVVRTLPRIGESAPQGERGLFERWITSEIPERADSFVKNFFHKFLRKTKIFILKMDNILTQRMKKIKPDMNGETKPDFKGITSAPEVEKNHKKEDNNS